MSEWKPIETAPNDGTKILVHYDDGETILDENTCGTNWKPYRGRHHNPCVSTPTHWMPLPPPPHDGIGER